jgi:hypothetical protein
MRSGGDPSHTPLHLAAQQRHTPDNILVEYSSNSAYSCLHFSACTVQQSLEAFTTHTEYFLVKMAAAQIRSSNP